ncbi:MAG: SWIM zinc finger domain-containing protein [Chloroflexi bacterium]|nr:SWIM zinc finger domain-containing protein [Chloroflexota bacterium]MCL5107960.1 SWIM zinc finger domain-containing protein [Chloroflexota bacterium]
MPIVPVTPGANPARAVALAPLIQWLPERTRRAERLAVRDLGGGEYEVASERQPGLVYRVHLPPPEKVGEGEQIRCECPDFQYRGIPCKHLLVVAEAAGGRERLFYAETAGGPGIPAGTPEGGPAATGKPEAEDGNDEGRDAA